MARSSHPSVELEAVRGYVVAGGRSSRMGRDKALLSFRGATLLEHAMATLGGVTEDVRVLCGPTPRYEGFGAPIVVDDICGAGPVAGLYAALVDASSSGIGRIVWLGVDLPLVTTAVIATLLDTLADADAVVARTERGLEPLCGAFRTEPCLNAVRSAVVIGRLKITDALEGVTLARIHVGTATFANINAPAELEALLRDDSQGLGSSEEPRKLSNTAG